MLRQVIRLRCARNDPNEPNLPNWILEVAKYFGLGKRLKAKNVVVWGGLGLTDSPKVCGG